MTDRLLVAVDGSEPSDVALAFATEEWPDAAVVLLHVVDPISSGYGVSAVGPAGEEWYERERDRAEDLLATAAESVDGTVETRVEVGHPASTIVSVVEGGDVDHVVVGSHGRDGVSRVILGSVAETVVRRSPVPVTVVG